MKIGNVTLKNNIIVAPMAGYTDLAFRSLCQKYGAGLVCTEMISSQALHYKNKKTEDMLLSIDKKPCAVQIFGHNPEIMAEAVKNPLLSKFDVIDLNMGCPAPKIIKNGDGGALLKNVELARKIIEACVKITKKPITVKFRIGYDEDHINAIEFAKMCENAGATAITVHGRTVKQGYSGAVRYDVIKSVKESVKIPVFANGDCKTKKDVDKILNETCADGIMIGRAAIGNPEIFAQITKVKSMKVDKFKQIKFHYETMLKFYSEKFVMMNMRTHLANYLKPLFGPKAVVQALKFNKYADFYAFLTTLFNKN